MTLFHGCCLSVSLLGNFVKNKNAFPVKLVMKDNIFFFFRELQQSVSQQGKCTSWELSLLHQHFAWHPSWRSCCMYWKILWSHLCAGSMPNALFRATKGFAELFKEEIVGCRLVSICVQSAGRAFKGNTFSKSYWTVLGLCKRTRANCLDKVLFDCLTFYFVNNSLRFIF